MFYVLQALLKVYEVDLLFFGSESSSAKWVLPPNAFRRWQAVAPVKRTPRRYLASVISPLPFHVGEMLETPMQGIVDQWCSEVGYSLLFINTSNMFALLGSWADRIPVVIDQHTAEPDVWNNLAARDPRLYVRWYARLNRPKALRFARKVYPTVAAVASITERDRQITLEHFSPSEIVVAPQGVDFDYYFPMKDAKSDPMCLLFSGTGATRNADAVRYYLDRIQPNILAKGLQPHLLWIGNVQPHQVPFLNHRSDVTLTGFVEHTPPYFDRGLLYIAPFRMGEGMKTKIIEALAMGKVVVSTSVGVQGIDLAGCPFVRVADDPRDFAQHVCELLKDPEQLKRLGDEARDYAKAHYSWEKVLAPLLAVVSKHIKH